jgi:sugar O-acyltransferase (sialic acid O-acetyltransferase NeuD family)
MADIVVFGASQTAEIVHYYFTNDSPHRIVAFTVDGDHLESDSFMGLPVVPFEDVERHFPTQSHSMHVAVSYTNLNKLRHQKYVAAKNKGYRLESYISSRSGSVGPVVAGDNCLILENQSIQPGARIGCNVAIFGGVLIGHHSFIGDHCWITSEVAIAGNANIGERCFLGINATIGHFVALGSDCFIGAGTLVTKSLPGKSVVLARDTEIYPLDSERFMKITKMQ